MDGDHVVEAQRLAVGDEGLEHRRFETGLAPLGERMPDAGEECDPGFLEVGEVVAVVHDAHRIGLDEPDSDLVGEVVVRQVTLTVRRRGAPDECALLTLCHGTT